MDWIDVSDYERMCQVAARRMFDFIVEKVDGNKPFNIGLATGNTMIGVYDRLAKKLNEAKTDLSGMSTFNLDEYVDVDGTNVKENHPLSYRKYMKEKLFEKLNPTLGFRNDRMFFPDASHPEYYDSQIAEAGGIDFQLLGIGFNGHIAFNEPMKSQDITVDDFMKLPSRVIDLTDLTLQTNAQLTADDDLNTVPQRAVTQGMRTIMDAKEVLLLACFKEQTLPLQQIKAGNLTSEIPASCLLKHPNCTIIYTKDAIAI